MKVSLKRLIVIICLVTLGGGIAYFSAHRMPSVTQEVSQGPIYDYDEARDRQEILNIFETERYWLLTSPDYDLEFMLKYKAPNKDPLYVGRLYIKVLRENNKFVGFTTYYKKTPIEGTILFVAVKKEFRGKGYGQILVKYDLDELKRLGSKKVSLVTRIQNLPGQALYKKTGFTEVKRDATHVYYEIPTT